MTQFTGTGMITLDGNDARFYDIECQNTGGFVMDGNGQRLENCVMLTDVTVADGSQRAIIRGNVIEQGGVVTLAGNNDHTIIVGNHIAEVST